MKSRPSVEVVRYRDPSKKKRKRENVKKANGLLQTLDNRNDTKFMKTKDLLARLEFDVNTFALSGFSKEEKRKRERDRALKLGAVPRKKKRSEKPMNYKVISFKFFNICMSWMMAFSQESKGGGSIFRFFAAKSLQLSHFL